MKILDHIRFVIVEPKTPGNIGSLCRACKNMGISDIVLVNPVEYLVSETYRMGWGSEDLINTLKVVSTFDEAIQDAHCIIGTTMRTRDYHPPLFSPKDLV